MCKTAGLRSLFASALAGVLCAFAVPAAAQYPAATATQPWRVVLIRSWDALYPINTIREEAMRRALTDNAPRVIEIYPEDFDPLRFSQDIETEYVALLRRKYRALKIDLVIASGPEPLEFAARYRDDLWPGAPIVFNGVIDGTLDKWTRPPRTTGVTMAFDFEGALKVGLQLVPTAKKVYFVAGNSPFDEEHLAVALHQAARIETLPEKHYLVGLTTGETVERLAHVEPDSLVMYVTMLRDGSGRISGPGAENMRRVAAGSAAPVLSAIQTQFGRGPLGGSSARIDLHGAAAGRLAREILEGGDPDAIPILAQPDPSCELDWNGLRRWHIPSRNVPGNCAIVNRPVSPLEAYLWPLVGLLAIILLQSGLLWSLALQSARRRRAETELAARRAELTQVGRLSMVGALTASIAHEINQPMGAILSNAEAASMMLEQGTLDTAKLREILADIRDENLRASEVIRGLRKMAARTEWNPVALEVNTEVAEALRHVAFEAARRGVKLLPSFDAAVPGIQGDSVQLQQVVINLVVNAIEAVAGLLEEAREVRVETHGRRDGAEIVVSDRGPGIAPEVAERLFDAMFTTKNDGMGFGLSIARAIVEMHRGKITFEPNVPRGAVFRVHLPAIGT